MVVAAAEVVLEEHVEHDEQVAAAHLLELELRLAGGAVAPGDRHDGVAVAADERLQRDLDREVEVVGQQRLDAVDDLAPVGLECVRRVVVAVAEDQADREVDDPVEQELEARVAVGAGAGHEARAERALVALLEQPPVRDEVARRVREVGHHDRDRVTAVLVEAAAHGQPEARAARVGDAAHGRPALADPRDDRGRRVRAVVVDDEHLVVDALGLERVDERLDRARDRALLVVRRDDDRQLQPGSTGDRG